MTRRDHLQVRRVLEIVSSGIPNIIDGNAFDFLEAFVSAEVLTLSQPAAAKAKESVTGTLALHDDSSRSFVECLV